MAKKQNNIVDLKETQLITEAHSRISGTKTPSYYVNDKNGMDYVDEGYMRLMLNEEFPVWSWEVQKYEFMGDKAIAVHGRLTIVDNGVPRYFESIAAHRIAVSSKTGNYVDLGNDLKSAVTDCFKVCVNRLTNIADDVYRKQYLNSNQISQIEDKLAEVMDASIRGKVVRGIKGKTINAVNLEGTLTKLDNIIAKQSNEKEK